MDKQINKRKEYVTNPARIISFCIFIFWLWVAYATINNRIERLETFQKEINLVEIQSTLSQIQTDIERIKINLNSKK